MQIRAIAATDNEKIENIIKRSLEQLGLNIPGTAYFDAQLSDLHSFYEALPQAQYWVVELAGEVVGGIGIAPFDEENRICELQKLYLSEAAKGQRLGKKLMEHALAFAEKYYASCYLETMHKLETACKLYEEFGFELLTKPLPGSEHSTMDAWYLKKMK